jgi:hypothetical protein
MALVHGDALVHHECVTFTRDCTNYGGFLIPPLVLTDETLLSNLRDNTWDNQISNASMWTSCSCRLETAS